MQKRKFDELISHFNRKVSDMSIDQKYKMELLGMISAIGFAHEKELSTNLAEVGTGCSENPNNSDAISRQSVIDVLDETKRIARQNIDGAVLMTFERVLDSLVNITNALPTIQPEPKRGKWIYCEDTTADCVDGYRCDQCGFFVPWDYQHKGIDFIQDYNFCPYCGSDMREVNNESN